MYGCRWVTYIVTKEVHVRASQFGLECVSQFEDHVSLKCLHRLNVNVCIARLDGGHRIWGFAQWVCLVTYRACLTKGASF